ncbi:hypothetical protein WJX79_001746 [Trebouxia sp. C0005]|nr:MAG: cycloartenol synthase [Trebouxia sp. A1-2]
MWKFVSSGNSGSHPWLRSLNDNAGRQTWEYVETATPKEKADIENLQNGFTHLRHQQRHSADELLRMQSTSKRRATISPPKVAQGKQPTEAQCNESVRSAMYFYESLQQDDGHWPGDYGGPMFLMPGLIITLYVTGCLDTVLSIHHKHEMTRYLHNHQNKDGGFGLHIEGPSTMFGTVLSYVSLRLLGSGPEDAAVEHARAWIHKGGGATYITSWGKFWLAVLGVYSWDGMNPTPPEMWLLPYASWTGIGLAHPGRYWCHCRMVYLPMSYVYGKRGICKETPLTAAIRGELYPHSYSSIDWNAARNQCAKEDLYYPHPKVQDALWWSLYQAEGLLKGSWLRKKALAECMKLIHYEDENTRYVCIGPVNKAINMLCCWLEDPESEAFKRHIPRVQDFLWVAEDGMKMQGYNGSQLWDTSFAVQAITAAGLAHEFGDCLRKAHSYIDVSQVREDCPGDLSRWYRHISKGAWPFSTRDHGWPISDCSADGLKAALALAELDDKLVGPAIPDERIYDCVNVILSLQNADGGWSTYESTRSYPILEMINPSETFGDILIDYSYVELSSTCIAALAKFGKKYPAHRAEEISKSKTQGRKYILSMQRPDGSWYGNWGVCFTYAAWFGCDALAVFQETADNSTAQSKACDFLVSKQRKDGGWAESYLSSQTKEYHQLPEETSHVVNTAWALLALLAAGYHKKDRRPLDGAARCLMNSQLSSGDWPQQHISGVFNRNCMITYANYRNIFPLWALGKYRALVLGNANGQAH